MSGRSLPSFPSVTRGGGTETDGKIPVEINVIMTGHGGFLQSQLLSGVYVTTRIF